MSDSDSDKEENYSTLRELLIRPSHKPNGGNTGSPPESPHSEKKKPKSENIDEVNLICNTERSKEKRGVYPDCSKRACQRYLQLPLNGDVLPSTSSWTVFSRFSRARLLYICVYIRIIYII